MATDRVGDMELSDFIAHHMAKPWAPGEVDCLLALADWCVWLGYPDPAAHLRGSYDDEAGYQAIIEQRGGVIPLLEDCAAFLRVNRTETPCRGDVGVVGSRTNVQRQFGGIWDADEQGWRVRFANDYPAVRAHPLAIWKL